MAKICQEYKKRVEEEIEEPIRRKRKEAQRKCKRKKCKWWCACCNKWKCWIKTFIYWVTEWIVKIVIKWIPYILCRVVSALFTLVYTLIVTGLGILRVVGHVTCVLFGNKDVDDLSMKYLRVEVVIIDSETQTNPVTEAEINQWIVHADRIFREEAKITIKKIGEIRRDTSNSLYEIDASSLGSKIGEWLEGIFTLWGRDSARHLTIYAVGKIKGSLALHLPLYGSVFIQKLDNNGNPLPDTTLAHEIGHALLAIWNTWHNKNKDYLMHTPAEERQTAANWPTDVPKISHSERCAMRQSRWLDLSVKDLVKIGLTWVGIYAATYQLTKIQSSYLVLPVAAAGMAYEYREILKRRIES